MADMSRYSDMELMQLGKIPPSQYTDAFLHHLHTAGPSKPFNRQEYSTLTFTTPNSKADANKAAQWVNDKLALPKASDYSDAIRTARQMNMQDANPQELRQLAQNTLDTVGTEGITTFHGSPTSGIRKFDLNFRGTGEGRLAPDSPLKESFKDMIAHGLYTAENEGIAKGYQDRLSGLRFSHNGEILADGTPKAQAAEFLWGWQGDKAGVLDDIKHSGYSAAEQRQLKQALNELDWNKLKQEQGSTYTAELLPHPDEYLHWDKPLSEQPHGPTMQNIFGELAAKRYGPELGEIEARTAGNLTGQQAYDKLQALMGGESQKAASEYLDSLGIKGVKYLDGSSRNNNSWKILSPEETTSGKWVVSQFGGNNASRFDDAAEAQAFYKKQLDALQHNYVTFRPEAESVITHENGQRIPGALEDAYARVRDPESKALLEQRYPELKGAQ